MNCVSAVPQSGQQVVPIRTRWRDDVNARFVQ